MSYIVIWEFRVRIGAEKEFVAQYGPEGAWARLFRRSGGYVKTELLEDAAERRRFVTVDYWKSEAEFDRFLALYQADYQRLDKELEALTESEERLGVLIPKLEIGTRS